jgi:hypothetical protein
MKSFNENSRFEKNNFSLFLYQLIQNTYARVLLLKEQIFKMI